jgi:hypothetical protein
MKEGVATANADKAARQECLREYSMLFLSTGIRLDRRGVARREKSLPQVILRCECKRLLKGDQEARGPFIKDSLGETFLPKPE